jgi:HSP20 family protein
MKIENIRQGFGSLWGQVAESVTEGWDRLRQTASTALTRFLPTERTALPAREQIDDSRFRPVSGWAMLGGDLFEDAERVVVRIEAPGLSREDFDVQVHGQTLIVRGEKRFEREATQGRWRLLQCAYGSFERRVGLPVPVKGDAARADYRHGVLRIELPKAAPAAPLSVNVRVG